MYNSVTATHCFVFDKTIFYPRKANGKYFGGQVNDTGFITVDGQRFQVIDVLQLSGNTPGDGIILHFCILNN